MKAFRGTPLSVSIASVIGAYGALEAIAFVAIAAAFGFSPLFIALYMAAQTLYQCGLCLFLLAGSSYFYNVNTGERLSRVNAANKVTLFRVSMLPFILFLIVAARKFPVAPILIPALAATFITDLIDGRISRVRNQVTLMGKLLDSISDYALLIVVAVAYFTYDLIPSWLCALILFRLFFQAIGMLFVLLIKKRVEPRPTLFGKIAVATIMTLFATVALKLVLPPRFLPLFSYIESTAGVLVAISVFDKGLFFLKEATRPAEEPEAGRNGEGS